MYLVLLKKNRLVVLISCFMFILTGCFSNKSVSTHQGSGKNQQTAKSSEKRDPSIQKPYKVYGKYYYPISSSDGFTQKGVASWYGKKFHGRKTSNGETYNMYGVTAAHKTLPFGTYVDVHNLDNGKKITVRINDRGPFVKDRIIDLSFGAAKKLDVTGPGTARVRITALGRKNKADSAETKKQPYIPLDYSKGNFTIQVAAFKVREMRLIFKKDTLKNIKMFISSNQMMVRM